MPQYLYIINNETYVLGHNQQDTLDAIMNIAPENLKPGMLNKPALKGLREKKLVHEDELILTKLGTIVAGAKPDEEFETWGKYQGWKWKEAARDRKERNTAPCQCSCYGCKRNCKSTLDMQDDLIKLLQYFYKYPDDTALSVIFQTLADSHPNQAEEFYANHPSNKKEEEDETLPDLEL